MHIALCSSAIRADLFPQGSCSHRMQIRLFLLIRCLSSRSVCCCQQTHRLIFSLPYQVSLCSQFPYSLQITPKVYSLFHRQMLRFSAFHNRQTGHDSLRSNKMSRLLSSWVSIHSADLHNIQRHNTPASAGSTAALCSSGCCSRRMHIRLSLSGSPGILSSLN